MTGRSTIEYTPRLARRWAGRNRAAETGAAPWHAGPVPLTPVPLRPGDTVDFHGSTDPRDPTRAHVQAATEHYALVTAPVEGQLWYTLISWADGWRGPLPTDTIPAADTAAGHHGLLDRLEASHRGDPEADPTIYRLAAHRARRLDLAAVHRHGRTVWGGPPTHLSALT